MAGLTARDRENARRRYQRRLAALYARATPDQRAYGADWYGEALREATALASEYDTTPERVAGAIAALSPRVHWLNNLQDARALLDWYYDDESSGYIPLWALKRHLSAYGPQVDKAVDILGTDDPLTILNGPKETAFYLNIIGDPHHVTVDVWMTRAATAGALDTPGTRARYEDIAAAVRRAARAVGATPRDFQAAVWLVARETIGHEGRRPDGSQRYSARLQRAA